MRIDLEQFLALTVAIGSIGAIGVAVYTSQPGVGSLGAEATTIESFSDELELDRGPDPAPILTVPLPTPAQPAPPLATDEAPSPVAEPTSDEIPDSTVEGANW